MKIIEKTIKSYEVHTDAGDVQQVSIEVGTGCVSVMSHGSFGTYGYTWNATGHDPINFLKMIEFDYAMTKFKGNYHEFCSDSQKKFMLKKIKELRKYGDITRETARDFWESIEAICEDSYSSHEYVNRIYNDREIIEIFYENDYSAVSAETRPNANCVGFWSDIWKPLMKTL